MRPFDSIKGRFIRDPTWWRKRPDSRACLNASSLSQTGCKTTGVHPLHYYVRRGSRYNTPFFKFQNRNLLTLFWFIEIFRYPSSSAERPSSKFSVQKNCAHRINSDNISPKDITFVFIFQPVECFIVPI